MRKYFVRITYPDITVSGCPDIQTTFQMWSETGYRAAEKAKQWGIVIIGDMMRYNGISPYIIDYTAASLVKVLSVKAMEDSNDG